jgi:fructose-bisphosphate aldolase class II
VLSAVKKTNTPVILGVSEGAGKYMCGFKNVVDMVNNVIQTLDIKQPVALHLDHGSYEGCKQALIAGFSSIMFDGSSLPFNENLTKSKELIALSKKYNASIELEVGAIGGEEDGHIADGELANVEECKIMSELDITCLAAGIGNIHGIYPPN